jgi:aminoglycoside phosphotransferase (APT) family kinase protein
MDYWPDALNEVRVSRWLCLNQFPAAELFDTTQPIEAAGRPVTFWKFIEGRGGSRQDIATLGHVLRRLHRTPPPTDFDLPDEDILGRVGPRIAAASLPFADKDFLLQRLTELQGEVAGLSYPLPPAPTHGDAHSENLMIRGDQAIIIDFERFSWGQPEWDLAMTATEFQTGGWWTEEEYHRFADAYGYDVMSWTEGFETLRSVHEIKMTTWLMQNVNVSQEIADEFQVRMRTIRGEIPRPANWRAF